MTFTAFLLILTSAVFHATWNLLSKAYRPSLVFYMQASMTAALLWLGFVIAGVPKINWGALPGMFYIMITGSFICEVIYFTGLANAYKRSDISIAYPMARALPVLFTALLTLIFHIGKPLNSFGLTAMLLIFTGCFIMPLQSFRHLTLKSYLHSHFIFILMAACGTTGYTIFDSQALKYLQEAFPPENKILMSCTYLGIMEILIFLTIAVITPLIKSERQELKTRFCRTIFPSCSGVFSTMAYGIILLAMPLVTNVSFIQAFRQLSLPICALAGVLLLHEKITPPRVTGLFLILTGLILSVI